MVFFIRKGMVRLSIPLQKGLQHHIATFGSGDFFGDMSFLDKAARSADAIAQDEVELYVLPRENFNRVLEAHPRAASRFFEHLAYAISKRLRLTTKELTALEEI